MGRSRLRSCILLAMLALGSTFGIGLGFANGPDALRSSPFGPSARAPATLAGAIMPKPACTTAVASAPTLSHVTISFTKTIQSPLQTGPGAPFGVAVASDDRHVFVTSGQGLDVYRLTISRLLPESVGVFQAAFAGLTITRNNQFLIAPDGNGGAIVFDVARILTTTASDFWPAGHLQSSGQGAIEAVASPDGDYVFVSLEDSDDLAVFDLARALSDGFGPDDLIGTVPLGTAPVGLAISPNGRHLYATSEGTTAGGDEGTLTTIDLSEAERSPSHSVISTVFAGCEPVRVDATRLWVYVTARASDELLAFSARDLISDPSSALQRRVRVGEAPVGLALARRDRTIVVADSNRFQAPGKPANLAVVSVERNGDLALDGYVPSGSFPRDMAITHNGRVLIVANFDSNQVETVATSTLP